MSPVLRRSKPNLEHLRLISKITHSNLPWLQGVEGATMPPWLTSDNQSSEPTAPHNLDTKKIVKRRKYKTKKSTLDWVRSALTALIDDGMIAVNSYDEAVFNAEERHELKPITKNFARTIKIGEKSTELLYLSSTHAFDVVPIPLRFSFKEDLNKIPSPIPTIDEMIRSKFATVQTKLSSQDEAIKCAWNLSVLQKIARQADLSREMSIYLIADVNREVFSNLEDVLSESDSSSPTDENMHALSKEIRKNMQYKGFLSYLIRETKFYKHFKTECDVMGINLRVVDNEPNLVSDVTTEVRASRTGDLAPWRLAP